MEPEHGRGITENKIQSRHDNGNPFTTSTNQVDINSEVLQNPFVPGDGNAPLAVSSQAETIPSAAFRSPLSPSSSSGSSYESSNDDDHSISILPEPEGNGVRSVTPEHEFTPDLSADTSAWSMVSSSPRSGPGYLIHDSMFTEDVDWRNPDRLSLSSPPAQIMVHEDGYDPNRIPSSVFASKPPSSDWSTASNESLFSIYMGNSFAGGYPSMLMSGEFRKNEGLNNSHNPFEAKANEENDFSPNLPTLHETSPELETQQSENIKDDNRIQEGPSKISTVMTEESKENQGNKTSPEADMTELTTSSHKGGLNPFEKTNSIQNRLSNSSEKDRLSTGSSNKSFSSRNRLSDDSERSYGSFAFPVLVADVGKSSSFRMKTDKHVEPPKKQQFQPPQPQTTTRAQPPQTTTQPAETGKGCWSFLPGWKCC